MTDRSISILSYGNTFGELVTTLNKQSIETNNLIANNYTKDSGTLFLNEADLGLQVANNAVVQGGLKVYGTGSYAYVQNNLQVDGQVYFTNPTLGLTNFGQANVYGLLYANSTANSIIATNNVTVGGNTFITGNVYSANNLVIAGTANIGGHTQIYGTTNIANTLLVSQNTYVHSYVVSDKSVANTSSIAPNAYVTNLLDVGTGLSQLNIVTANNLTTSIGYIDNLQSNTNINAAVVNTSTLYAQSLSTPTANVINTIDANNASGYVKNLTVSGQLTITGNLVSTAPTVYTANTFTLSAGSSTGINSAITVNRGSSGSNAAIRWNESQAYWDILNVSNGNYYQVLTTEQTLDTLISRSTTQPASANVANTLNTLLNNANNYLQLAVANAGAFGNGAFLRANSAFDAANNVAPQIAPAFTRANAAYDRANTSSNTFTGTVIGSISPTNGGLTFSSNNGLVIAGAGNTMYFSTSQGLRTTDSPTFASLTLTAPLSVTQGGTGAQSSSVALQNLLPSTVGVPSGYVLGTTGGLGASFNWVAGGTGGGGGGTQPGTRISTNRLSYTASDNQTDFTTPTYVTGSGQLRVYVNGVRQYTADYTETSTTSVSMTSPLKSGDTVLIEVDGYYTWNNWANTTTFTAPFGGISSTANTVQLAIQDVETRKATLASPTFTGVPTAPRASLTTANSQIATTEWVSSWANTGYTYVASVTGNAGSVTNGVYTNGSYSDPSWLTLSKSKVGLGNVDNTADANKSVSFATNSTNAVNATNSVNATYLGTTQQTSRITGATNSLAMAASDSTNLGSFVCRASGTGDGNLAGITYWNDSYAVKQGVRSDGYFGLGGWSSAAWVWYVSPEGYMTAAKDVTAFSDPRLKENFKRFEKPLDLVSQLDGGSFNWKSGIPQTEIKAGTKDYGILADQVEKIMPEIVSEGMEIDGQSYKTVAYDKLIPLLIESVKALKAEIEELKGQIK